MELFERMEALESAEPPDPDAIADIDVRVWVDGPGQPETRVPAAIRDKVRAMDAPQYAPDRVHGRPIPLDPPANDATRRPALPRARPRRGPGRVRGRPHGPPPRGARARTRGP